MKHIAIDAEDTWGLYMADEPLKSCPFCGGKANIIHRQFFNRQDNYSINCSKCHVETLVYKTEIEAINVWNQRV